MPVFKVWPNEWVNVLFLINSNEFRLVELLDTLDTYCKWEIPIEQWALRSPAQETGRGSISGSPSASTLLLNCRSATLCSDFLQLPTATESGTDSLLQLSETSVSASLSSLLSQPRCSSQENHPSVSWTHPQVLVFPQRRAPLLLTLTALVEIRPISGFNPNPVLVLLHDKQSPLFLGAPGTCSSHLWCMSCLL